MVYSDSHVEISLDDGIIKVKYLAEFLNDPKIVETLVGKRLEIQNGKTYPMLVDVRKVKGGNLNFRKKLACKDCMTGTSAISIVCSNKFHIAVFNYFNLKKCIPMPASMFTDENKAIQWLNTFKEKENNNFKVNETDNKYFQDDSFEMTISDGIIYVKWLKENYNVDDIDSVIKKRLELSDGYFYPIYTDFTKVKYGSRSAMRRLSSMDALLGIVASAAYCRSRVQQTLFRLFHVLFKPKIPSRYFTDKQAAISWLERFRMDNIKNF